MLKRVFMIVEDEQPILDYVAELIKPLLSEEVRIIKHNSYDSALQRLERTYSSGDYVIGLWTDQRLTSNLKAPEQGHNLVIKAKSDFDAHIPVFFGTGYKQEAEEGLGVPTDLADDLIIAPAIVDSFYEKPFTDETLAQIAKDLPEIIDLYQRERPPVLFATQKVAGGEPDELEERIIDDVIIKRADTPLERKLIGEFRWKHFVEDKGIVPASKVADKYAEKKQEWDAFDDYSTTHQVGIFQYRKGEDPICVGTLRIMHGIVNFDYLYSISEYRDNGSNISQFDRIAVSSAVQKDQTFYLRLGMLRYAYNHVRRFTEGHPMIFQPVPEGEIKFARAFGFKELVDKPGEFKHGVVAGNWVPTMLDPLDLYQNQKNYQGVIPTFVNRMLKPIRNERDVR